MGRDSGKNEDLALRLWGSRPCEESRAAVPRRGQGCDVFDEDEKAALRPTCAAQI